MDCILHFTKHFHTHLDNLILRVNRSSPHTDPHRTAEAGGWGPPGSGRARLEPYIQNFFQYTTVSLNYPFISSHCLLPLSKYLRGSVESHGMDEEYWMGTSGAHWSFGDQAPPSTGPGSTQGEPAGWLIWEVQSATEDLHRAPSIKGWWSNRLPKMHWTHMKLMATLP